MHVKHHNFIIDVRNYTGKYAECSK